jgi:hypothetical protein
MTNMTSPTSSFLSHKEEEWSIISGNDREETTPTVKVDSLDLNTFSVNKGDKEAVGDHSICIWLTLDPTLSKRSLVHSMWSDEMKTKQKENEIYKASETSEKKEKELGSGNTNIIQNRYEVSVKLLDQQADPSSPLYSVKTFEELGL